MSFHHLPAILRKKRPFQNITNGMMPHFSLFFWKIISTIVIKLTIPLTQRDFILPGDCFIVIYCCQNALSLLGGDVVTIQEIGLDVFHLKPAEPSLLEHLAGSLLALHRPQSSSLFRQGDGHAVIARDRVEKGC